MRIAITHPTAWPEVRRGSERLLNDLSLRMAARGHAVSVIASAPDRPAGTTMEDGIRRVWLARRNPPAALTGRWFNHFHLFGRDLTRLLLSERFDAVHCLNYHDAAGAVEARRAGARFRLVFQCTGIPVRRYFRRIPLDGLLFRTAVRGADAVAVLSRFAADALAADYGVAGTLLPSPTEPGPFEAQPDRRAADPYILFSGDADEPRKGALLLARAFPAIAKAVPGLRLLFTGRAGSATRAAVYTLVPENLRGQIGFLGIGRIEDLPALYAQALVCVNPAVWEALGNVLTEALAAGTPVVGARHGGIPDILEPASPNTPLDAPVGVLFEPHLAGHAPTNTTGLADAVLRAVALAGSPGIRERCRARGRAFSWEMLAPRYARFLGETVSPDECGSVRNHEPQW